MLALLVIVPSAVLLYYLLKPPVEPLSDNAYAEPDAAPGAIEPPVQPGPAVGSAMIPATRSAGK
ncbi:hypothetical protein J19TS2_04680 [Cohnella xylanilytica]|uniref:Uncharacterized protein n=1 Tax=Cohnella xylanilytica TaxID=557555 RepID=A0A841TV43_9BACL|nr:hypothetical protein [Cohnella xylanilytica]MBB6690812.1 hypothetical protein [Cohnella xylanilytica]GIO10913.1 hypothetical protein J19TS2_04680 [Cohnella xylanilytica]